MFDADLIDKLYRLKETNNYTLNDLSKRLDVQISTIERWLKTKRINKVYAQLVRQRLGIS